MARAQLQNIGDLDPFLREVMDGVGIVPKHAEVRSRGLHGRQPLSNPAGIDRSCWVAVFGNAPDAFNRGVLRHQPLHLVHVRVIFPERHRNHANPVVLADLEVPVVAWNRAQEGNLSLLRPGSEAIASPLEQRVNDGVVHQGEARVVGGNYLFRRRSHHGGEKPACFHQPLQSAVVTAIDCSFGDVILRPRKR